MVKQKQHVSHMRLSNKYRLFARHENSLRSCNDCGVPQEDRKIFKKKKKAFGLSSVVIVTCFTNEVKPLSQILLLIQTLNLSLGGVSAGIGGGQCWRG